jgi:hypothetical protein
MPRQAYRPKDRSISDIKTSHRILSRTLKPAIEFCRDFIEGYSADWAKPYEREHVSLEFAIESGYVDGPFAWVEKGELCP